MGSPDGQHIISQVESSQTLTKSKMETPDSVLQNKQQFVNSMRQIMDGIGPLGFLSTDWRPFTRGYYFWEAWQVVLRRLLQTALGKPSCIAYIALKSLFYVLLFILRTPCASEGAMGNAGQLIIDFSPVAYSPDFYNVYCIIDGINNTVISGADTPEVFFSLQLFAP